MESIFETALKFNYWYFFKSYFSASLIRSPAGREVIYFLQPGHYPACHLHIRPKNDAGLLSYFALKAQLLQLCFAIGQAVIWAHHKNGFASVKGHQHGAEGKLHGFSKAHLICQNKPCPAIFMGIIGQLNKISLVGPEAILPPVNRGFNHTGSRVLFRVLFPVVYGHPASMGQAERLSLVLPIKAVILPSLYLITPAFPCTSPKASSGRTRISIFPAG